jgi:hypothetical protein
LSEQERAEAISAQLRSLAEREVLRVLLCFGNPLGNAIGDTAMATQHISFLRGLNPASQITVWTSNSSLWKKLGDEDLICSSTVASITSQRFDLCIFDWVSAGEDLLAVLRQQRIFSIVWPSWGTDPLLFSGKGEFEHFRLPVGVNQPARISQLYQGLNIGQAICRGKSRLRSTRKVVLQPFASIESKSIPPGAALTLAQDICRAFGEAAEVVVPLPPRQSSEKLLGLANTVKRLMEGDVSSNVRFADSLSLSDYIDLLAGAALVIGPDSSSQHIAARCAVPSIALYPQNSGYNYFFFGPQDGENLQLRFSGIPGEKPLSTGVVFLASRLLNRQCGRLPQALRTSVITASRAFDSELTAFGNTGILKSNAFIELVDLLSREFPTDLTALCRFLIDEITTVWREAERIVQSDASPEALHIIRQRARSLNSSRIIRTLCA